MSPCKQAVLWRDRLRIAVLIASVCFVTFAPAMYLVFHALQWKGALRVLELAFPPALLLACAAGLLAYQRARIRREACKHETSYAEEERT